MSDVTEKMHDQKLIDRENLTAVELTDKELEKVTGAEFGFLPFNNSQSLAVTTIAFTTNNSGMF
jgi:hypothetical protein